MEHFLKHSGAAVDLQNRLGQVEHCLGVTQDALNPLAVGTLVANIRAQILSAHPSAAAHPRPRGDLVLRHTVPPLADPARRRRCVSADGFA